jgi:serine/threonine protein phosphatase PrpC
MQGGRLYMEDDYVVRDGGRFVGVFDGHGGSGVSRYLRTHLYTYFRQAWKRAQLQMTFYGMILWNLRVQPLWQWLYKKTKMDQELLYQPILEIVGLFCVESVL